MSSNSIVIIFLFSFAFTSSFGLGLWETFNQEKKEELVSIYKICESSQEQVVCRGIYGTDCIRNKNCNYINLVVETDDLIAFYSLDLDEKSFKARPNALVYLIGFSPYESDHGNATAKCEAKISRSDFKFFIYNPDDIEPEDKSSGFSRTERLVWNGFRYTNIINKTSWEQSCRDSLDLYKARSITEYDKDHMMTSNGEFIVILEAKYFQEYTNQQKLVFRDMAEYKHSDGVLFTNFKNKNCPEHQQKYKVPDSKFSSSATSIPDAEFSSSAISRASGLATFMILCTIFAIEM